MMPCTLALTDCDRARKACRLLNQFTYTHTLRAAKDESVGTGQRVSLWTLIASLLADTSQGGVA